MKVANWVLILLGIAGLIAIRFFEDRLFYDPFLEYFHEADKTAKIPDFEGFRLVLSHIFRFGLNLFFSAMVVQQLFNNKKWTAQAMVLMALVFLVTFPLYLFCVYSRFSIGYLFSFYVRRFVIQPVILLLIIPLFYYRKNLEKR